MNIKLKAKINAAIDKIIIGSADDELWDGWIHDELITQMTNAAEIVFDSAMKAQEFAKDQE